MSNTLIKVTSGLEKVSKHTADPKVINVVDISPRSLKDEKAFIKSAQKAGAKVIRDRAVHVEIKQKR